MSTYFAILTAVGEAKIANAQALETVVRFTHLGVGDGGGAPTTPDRMQPALVNEVRRASINSLEPDPVNANQIIIEQVIPENVGGWWIREIGVYDEDGDLVAVANCPPSYKPELAEGSGRTQVIRIVLVVTSVAAVQLKIDPAVVLATRAYVDAKVLVVASQAEAEAGAANDRTMTPLRTRQHGDARYALKGAFDSHAAAANPHNVTKAQVGLGSVENYPVASQAEAEAGAASNRYMTPQRARQHGDNRYATKASTQTIFVPAAALQYRLTDGATPVLIETATNKRTMRVLEFDAATRQYAQLGWVMPKGWDKGAVKVRFVWTATATGGVVWGAQGAALSDADALDAAWGAAQEVIQSIGTAGLVKISAETAAITLDAAPGDEDLAQLQVYRKADDATNDTLAVKARLIGLRVTYGTVSLNDA